MPEVPFLRHPLLESLGIPHGFGLRGCQEPPGLQRPRQVHGAGVAQLREGQRGAPGRADAIVCSLPGVAVGVATADCVPILLASGDGRVVAAVHAGWRGLARGVISSAVQALRQPKCDTMDAVAVLGPHVGPCCYEVDRPVVEALSPRFGERLQHALSPTRRGHWHLDLGTLTRVELIAAGLASERIGAVPEACTACDPQRFHSYRRDGPKAGRLIHFVRVRRQA